MKKPVLLVVSAAFFLSACGGGESSSVACESQYWDGTVGTCLPAEWKVLERSVLDQRGAPPEVVVAFQANEPVSGQFPTVTVTRETLKQTMTSPEYSELSVQSVATLPGYEEGSERSLTVDEEEVTLHTFTAQPRSEEPRVRFFQVSIASGTSGFTYTGAVPLTVPTKTENEIRLILENATLRETEE
jgi:hypothetical protein